MKAIPAAGGPPIGIDRTDLQRWTGVEGKGFIGEASSRATDVAATRRLIGGRLGHPRTMSKMIGTTASGILIDDPCETAVLDLDRAATGMGCRP